MREALSDAGFEAIECADLATARAAIARTKPAVVVLDLMLEDEFASALLDELPRSTDPPAVVVCSAFPLAHLIAARYSVPCVRKPFDLDVLVAAVNGAARDRGVAAKS